VFLGTATAKLQQFLIGEPDTIFTIETGYICSNWQHGLIQASLLSLHYHH